MNYARLRLVSEGFRERVVLWFANRLWPIAALVMIVGGEIPGYAVVVPPDGAPPDFRPDRLLVKPLPGVDPGELQELHQIAHATVLRRYPQIGGLQIVQIPPHASVPAMAGFYSASGFVEYAEPDFIVEAARAPNETNYANGNQWALYNWGQLGGTAGADIQAAAGWDFAWDASSIIVAVPDTGIRVTHEDLAENLWVNPGEIADNGLDDDANGYVDDVHGINARDGSGDLTDAFGHGTHVSGILGAVGNNGVGIAGTAWRVQLMGCAFLDTNLQGSVSDAIECLNYARLNGARIVNASWGGTADSAFFSNALYDGIASLRDAGIIFVAAAGNFALDNDSSNAFYPASFDLDNIISVAATTRDDDLAHFSCYGANTVDLGAPGYVVLSCWSGSDQDYRTDNGTSMAAPHVAAACALAWTLHPDEDYRQIIDRILAGTDPVPALAGKTRTGGRLNLAKVLDPALGIPAIRLVMGSVTNDSVQFQILGAPQTWIRIEKTQDLATWTPIATNQIPGSGMLEFADDAEGAMARYYRVVPSALK